MNGFIVKDATSGKGVFSASSFREGDCVMEVRGPVLTSDQLPQPYASVDDHYVQIGEDKYLGPSGGPDDLVNHSCDPNCGIVIDGAAVYLKAIRDIAPGEEITFDYSTVMKDDPWTMMCSCGSSDCRKVIGEFKALPASVKKRYVSLGIVPRYVLECCAGAC